MKALTLTTNQIQPGILIDAAAGPLFVPWRAVLAVVAAFLLTVGFRLALDTIAAAGLLSRLVAVNVEYHATIFYAGLQVITGGLFR